jgi:hypothetical protein
MAPVTLCHPEAARTVIHAFVNANAVALFVKLVAVSTLIAVAIATRLSRSGEGDERQYVRTPVEVC